MGYERLEGLQVTDYEYPGENNALALVKKIPVLDQVMAAYLKYISQLYMVPQQQGDFYRVTQNTCPQLYELYKKALTRLDMPKEYPLYIKAEYEYNAYTAGGDEPFLVLHSSMVKNLTEEELLFVIGHELGHVKSGHLIYSSMAQQIGSMITNIPFAGNWILSTGLHYALIHWRRMHEFTSDRAGVIAAGSIDAGCQGLGRLLGVTEKIPYVNFNLEDLKKQNDAFEELQEDILGKLLCTMTILEENHPFTVSRIQKLNEWQQSGEYE